MPAAAALGGAFPGARPSPAPGQVTGNAGALAFLSNGAGADGGSVWREASVYVWGKGAVYVVMGTAVILPG